VSYFPSAAAILFLFSNASYKERRCKLFVSSERYVRTAPFSTSTLGCTRMYWIPKSSPGCRASSLAVILPPAISCTLLFPSPGEGYSHDIMFAHHMHRKFRSLGHCVLILVCLKSSQHTNTSFRNAVFVFVFVFSDNWKKILLHISDVSHAKPLSNITGHCDT
jgi:hypothetical protein